VAHAPIFFDEISLLLKVICCTGRITALQASGELAYPIPITRAMVST
jgi:hypothetical protein